MTKFEKVSKFANSNFPMPTRKTESSAGYDLVAAEDIVIPSYFELIEQFMKYMKGTKNPISLKEMSSFTKETGFRPTLVSTGVKCSMDKDTYLELSVRSSTPLKHWLIMANGVGIIDADYYNNPDNEGEIFLQLFNISPYNIIIHKGDAIGQGIIKPYLTTENDAACGQRTGGFGSTSE